MFLKVGALLYGSGYVLVSFLDGELVDSRGWLTEEQLKPEELKKQAKQIKSGQKVSVDAKRMDAMMRQLQTQQNFALQPKERVGCSMVIWIVLAVLVGAAAVFIFALR